MLIHSDWHIYSEFSYDASLPLQTIADGAAQFGFRGIGITDHVNYNDQKFLHDLARSAEHVKEFQKEYPSMVLGVELTPIAKPRLDYIAKHGTRDGYVDPDLPTPFAIELPQTKEQLMERGVRYAIGASHWRIDVPMASALPIDLDAMIREWHRQQLWLACDERVTILGHPWYNGKAVWYEDFSVIPHSMNMEIAAALKENGKFVECNPCMLDGAGQTEKFRHQYAEFLRELFEMGIPITYGSDAHNVYEPRHLKIEPYLLAAGFRDGDFSDLTEKDLW